MIIKGAGLPKRKDPKQDSVVTGDLCYEGVLLMSDSIINERNNDF